MHTRCPQCGRDFEWPPLCIAAEAPWRELGVTEEQFEQRVELTKDQCVVNRRHFFVRGHVEIPIRGSDETFAWSVWCSLSEDNFCLMTDRWTSPGREADVPMFGWLQTSLPCYPETVPTQTRVHTRPVGQVPFVEVDPEHALGREQVEGISLDRLREFAKAVMGTDGLPQCDSCKDTQQ